MDPWFGAEDAAKWVIRKYARRLARHPGLRNRHFVDLEEELWGELGVAWCAFDPEVGPPSAYVSTVVHNAAVTLARRATVSTGRLGTWVPYDLQSLGSTDEQDLNDQCRDVRAAVATLPDDLRQVACLLAQYGPAEVARILGRTRAWVYRARDEIALRLLRAGLHES